MAAADQIRGIRFFSPTIDRASFLLHEPQAGHGPGQVGSGNMHVHREANAGRTLEFRFDGPWASAPSNTPNLFLHTRLEVIITAPNSRVFRLPAFFAGND
ncbi:MAG: hypothetical protein ACI841_004141 [Planctomycetota bacterium]|jgi:hypothetical protein